MSTDAAREAGPVEAQRMWERTAEDNALDRLQKVGLIAPVGDVDKILQTVINNLIVKTPQTVPIGVQMADHAEFVSTYLVTPGFFRVFGVAPAFGRGFEISDARRGAIVGLPFAQRNFGPLAVTIIDDAGANQILTLGGQAQQPYFG